MSAPPTAKRVPTGLALAAALTALIWAGGWPLRLGVLLVSCLGLHEFYAMRWPDGRAALKRAGLALGALIVLSQAVDCLWTLALAACVLPLAGLFFLFSYGRGNEEATLEDAAPLALGVLYIPFVLQLALYLSPAEQILVILAAVATDTGGYYAGTLFGKRKLWPAVSPKKTWEGFWGGCLLCVLVCALLPQLAYAQGWSLPRLPLWSWILAGLALNQAALFGDFFESALKRSLGVKDSGNLLPGHGGILDRIDSLLFTLPLYMLLRLAARMLQGA